MTSTDHIDDNQDLSAAEYVLGLLDPAAREGAEQRLRTDSEFAAEVARWETRFTPWLQAVAPVAAPGAAWRHIESALWAHAAAPQARMPIRRASWLDSLAFWRGLAVTGLAAAAASLVLCFVLLRQLPGTSAPAQPVVIARPAATAPMAAALRHDDGSIAYTATVDATGLLVLTPVQAGADARAAELWLIPAGDRPHSLGMLPRDRSIAVHIPVALRTALRDGLFAISMEPAGSGPHEAPTGPVVAKGNMAYL